MCEQKEYTSWVQHSDDMVDQMEHYMQLKYNAGQAAHGGELWNKPMMDHILAEIVDLVHYFLTHKAQVEQAIDLLDEDVSSYGIYTAPRREVQALNLLKYGNKYGAVSEELDPDTWKSNPPLTTMEAKMQATSDKMNESSPTPLFTKAGVDVGHDPIEEDPMILMDDPEPATAVTDKCFTDAVQDVLSEMEDEVQELAKAYLGRTVGGSFSISLE